jgi:hypothetical protein
METSKETRLANTEKDPREKNGKTGRTRWQTDESCRERPDLVEEASLGLHLSLGMSSKVVKVLRGPE